MKTLLILALAAYPVAKPPARYDHAFAGKTTVTRYATIAEVTQRCGTFLLVLGCAPIGGIGGVCNIQIARVGQDDQLIRHERAHCNGWAAGHYP